MNSWYVYMLRCVDGSLYTGVTTDPQRRLREHNTSDRLAARYTRARRPVILVWSEAHASRSSALKRERQLKKLKRSSKEGLLSL